MVDVMGHFGMALLWALPAWYLWDGRVSLLFVAFVLSTAMLPDVDLVLQTVLPVQHHGITHTVLFVTTVALVAGAIVEFGLKSWLQRIWLDNHSTTLATGTLFVFIVSGLLLGGFSHLFADMLSAPDIAPPIEPFWPFFDKPWSVDIAWYKSPLWNVGLLSLAVVLHVLSAYADMAFDHRWSLQSDPGVGEGRH